LKHSVQKKKNHSTTSSTLRNPSYKNGLINVKFAFRHQAISSSLTVELTWAAFINCSDRSWLRISNPLTSEWYKGNLLCFPCKLEVVLYQAPDHP
jgi:hypothetical protein